MTDKTQEWLEQNQYSRKSTLRYERIFGETWVSTGGEKTTREFCEKYLHLKPGQKVLDVGCGTGGSAFYMAEKYGALVHGVDLSSHMIAIAKEYSQKMSPAVQQKVSFEIADVTKKEFEKSSFDVIYTRDTVLHIPDKEGLYTKLKAFLKPGGILFITDYCRGDQDHSQEFKDYVKGRGYDLRTVKAYGKILEGCGYENVQAIDMTKPFIGILQGELDAFLPTKEEFIKDFTEQDFKEIEEGWKAKLVRCNAGDQAWGLFVATKPQ